MEAYDILTAVKQLEESGMERSESEAVARVIQAAVAPLAKDADLKAFRSGMNTELKAVRNEMNDSTSTLKTEIAELDAKITKLDARILIEVNKMAVSLTWRLATLVFLINGLFFAFERTF